jgi:hypothetical protein
MERYNSNQFSYDITKNRKMLFLHLSESLSSIVKNLHDILVDSRHSCVKTVANKLLVVYLFI